MKAVLAAYQRCAIPVGRELLCAGRNVMHRKTDAPIAGSIGRRGVCKTNVVQRCLARIEFHGNGFLFVDGHRNFLSPG